MVLLSGEDAGRLCLLVGCRAFEELPLSSEDELEPPRPTFRSIGAGFELPAWLLDAEAAGREADDEDEAVRDGPAAADGPGAGCAA